MDTFQRVHHLLYEKAIMQPRARGPLPTQKAERMNGTIQEWAENPQSKNKLGIHSLDTDDSYSKFRIAFKKYV